ncbi:MAG: inositol monophosphatase family protein [Gammaproteobacteria bacterium]|nr:inositol monophosphatase family protein [Gammaproteobacteria bacterium]
MQPMANMALRAARQAGQIILRAMDRIDRLEIEEKGHNDFVSNIDREAETAIIEVLHNAYPDHGIVGEEHGESFPSDEYTWVIDPLDGTTNFLQGIPHFCVSIALMKGTQFEHAVVVDPTRNEEFVASRGYGAQLNGKRIRVSNTDRLAAALLNTGIPPASVLKNLDAYMDMLKSFTRDCRALRRSGSAALDLAYVAAGRADGFWEIGLNSWDIAAGVLLVREAGGFVGDLNGGDKFFSTGNIVAANPRVFKTMVQHIRPHLTPELKL